MLVHRSRSKDTLLVPVHQKMKTQRLVLLLQMPYVSRSCRVASGYLADQIR